MPKSETLFKIILTGKEEVWLKSKYINNGIHLGPGFTSCVLGALVDCSDYEDMKEIEATLKPLMNKIQTLFSIYDQKKEVK